MFRADLFWFELFWFDLFRADLFWFDLSWFDLFWFDLFWAGWFWRRLALGEARVGAGRDRPAGALALRGAPARRARDSGA